MGLNDILASGVATANSITATLQVPVIHEAWLSNDGPYAKPLFASPVTRYAVVEEAVRDFRMPTGEVVTQQAKITFLALIPDTGGANRKEPIDPRDKLTLPSGRTGQLLSIEGVTNPTTSRPYVLDVVMG